jgi:hypothetical protein
MAMWLSRHPEIFIPDEKELHFFDREAHWSRGIDWYLDQFLPGRDVPVLGEASTSYMVYPHAVRRMAEIVPAARLIVQLRNPVDRAYSHFCFATAWGAEHRTFDAAVADELRGHIEVPGGEYLGRGRYRVLLDRVCDHFPREALHVVVFDDLVTTPEAVFRDACRFVGANESSVPPEVGSQANSSRAIRSRWLWMRTKRGRYPLRSPSDRSAKIDRLITRSFPPLTRETRSKLIDHFAEDNAALEQWLHRDLSSWRS